MTATKSWAYTTEYGFERITAWRITQERKKYNNESLRGTYWSAHELGRRKALMQKQYKNGATFFSYKNSADSRNGDDGGESLTHYLFKKALAGLSGTQLKLRNAGEHTITISHGEMEKIIPTEDDKYRADVYWHFTSTSSLGLKWSGELYVEVKHGHPVPKEKQENLKKSRVPVIEVPVLELFEYPFEGEDTTDLLEEAHVNRVRNILQKGFLTGWIINNPRSVAYLEQEVAALQLALGQTQQAQTDAKRTSDETLQQLKAASAQAASLRSSFAGLTQEKEHAARIANDLIDKLRAEKDKVHTLTQAREEANAQIEAQQKEIRLGNWMLWAAIALMAGIAGFLGYENFVAPDQNQAPQVVPTPSPQQAAPTSNAGKGHKVQPHATPRQRTQ
jgi:hypothetical protein